MQTLKSSSRSVALLHLFVGCSFRGISARKEVFNKHLTKNANTDAPKEPPYIFILPMLLLRRIIFLIPAEGGKGDKKTRARSGWDACFPNKADKKRKIN